MTKDKDKKGLYHRWSNKDGAVQIDAIISNDEGIKEEFEGFPVRSMDEFGDPSQGIEPRNNRYALFGTDYAEMTKFGRDLFVNGYEAYVLEVDWDGSPPSRWFGRHGIKRISGILRPETEQEREDQIGELWNMIEWSILQVPKEGLYQKGRAVNSILKMLVESYYNGHLDPVTRKVALGNILNTMRLQRGMRYDYETLARSQWTVAKEEFRQKRGLTEDEFKDNQLKNRKEQSG